MPRPLPLCDLSSVFYLVSYLLDDASERLVWSRWDVASRAGRALGNLSGHAARLSLPPAERTADWDTPVSAETRAWIARVETQAGA
ncbi:MAG TPA: hypothetical protein VGB53_04295 [Rubricoccaceae bacterium]|jgi:hypothetical protein